MPGEVVRSQRARREMRPRLLGRVRPVLLPVAVDVELHGREYYAKGGEGRNRFARETAINASSKTANVTT